MTALLQPQYPIKQLRNVRIPLADGVCVSANLFLPDTAGRFPAILQYIPYRKDDISASGAAYFQYMAERGFAGALVDIRGTGSSQGTVSDEYTLQEQLDACHVIDWLSRQEWCNGNVGMWGASYTGFNSIQVAMHNPPALKAIAPMFATDDRFNDDVHYYGGCLIGIEQILYPAGMVLMNATPPIAEYTGEDWMQMWQERLAGDEPWLLNWFRHQSEDDYWLQASLKRNYNLIKCPVFLIGGWADGYTNPFFHMLENLDVPTKAIIGPWMHTSPNNAIPGPGMHILNEMCRWWAHWLRAEDTGIMDEPRLAVYIQEGAAPVTYETTMPGKWRFYDDWPVKGVDCHSFYLGDSGELRATSPEQAGSSAYEYKATVGTAAGPWCAVMGIDGITRDQSFDDYRSLIFTSAALSEPVEILGAPKAILHISSTAEVAFFCVKLNDIAPDGSSRLVCRGILNATRRFGKDKPVPLISGEIYRLEIPFKYASWTFQPGHCIRLSVSSSDWPWVWPSPYPATNQVFWGAGQASQIILPIVTDIEASKSSLQFHEPVELPHFLTYESAGMTYEFTQDLIKGCTVHKTGYGGKSHSPELNLTRHSESLAEIGVSDENPAECFARATGKTSVIRQESRVDIIAQTAIHSTLSHFTINIDLAIDVDGHPFFKRSWKEEIPRLLL